ncbi:MAG: hypothetical protein RLZZ241_2138 [Bacteroidota bacterium]|jgi:3-oxoadipate enol-lactonase/4-carboxymuconolactone decarboxylase
MAFLQYKNRTIHYQWSNGRHSENVVLINSLGATLEIWNEVVPGLAKFFNVLTFDKRGHGLSTTAPGKVSIDDYADDIIGLLDALSIEKTHVLGLSIGGQITYSLGSRYPERVQKLIFSNTGAKIGTKQGWDERIAAVKEHGLAGLSEGIITRWLSPQFQKAHPEVIAGYALMVAQNSDLGYIQACEALREADYHPVLCKITQEVLFIGSTHDLSTPSEFVQENAKKLGCNEVALIAGVGHLPCLEVPEKTTEIILGFLQKSDLSLYDLGMKTRREVLGNTHVDRAEANKTDFDTDFQKYIVNSAWGSIWSRPHLTKRERSLVTIALLAALGHEEELAMHLQATKNTGASLQDIKEVLLHTGIYAGVPVTNGALKIAKEVLNLNTQSHE